MSLFRMAAAALLAAVVAVMPARAEDKTPPDEKRNVWMKQKLKLSQNILAGLTEGDFDAIEKGAAALSLSGYLENWVTQGKPQHAKYELQRANFDFYNRELVQFARNKSIEGATLAFQLMTSSCIECHKIVRDVKR